MESKKTFAEEIIKKIKEVEKEKEQDIYSMENDIKNGFIVVKYKKMDVEDRELLGGAIQMCIPKEFEIMEEEQAEIKYPGEDKPQYIYTNEDSTVNITFNIEEGEVNNEEIEEIKDMLSKEMQRLYPASKIEDNETIKAENKTVSYFSFDVPLLDGDVYNFMFFMALKQGLLMGAFNCTVMEKKQWEPIIKQMVATIKELEPIESKVDNKDGWSYGKSSLR